MKKIDHFLNRMVKKKKFMEAIICFACDLSKYVTGQIIWVDEGLGER